MAGIAILGSAMALVAPFSTREAHAHHGYEGPVRAYLETVRLEPRGDGWLIRAGLNDTASGRPAPGFVVGATGAGPQGATFGPVPLADLDADGRYEAGLGPLPAGDWSLTVEVGDVPGGEERVVPITRTWTVTLQPGQGLDVVGRRAAAAPPGDGAPSESGSGTPLPLAMGVGAAGLLGLSAAWLIRRRRAMVPAR